MSDLVRIYIVGFLTMRLICLLLVFVFLATYDFVFEGSFLVLMVPVPCYFLTLTSVQLSLVEMWVLFHGQSHVLGNPKPIKILIFWHF